MCQTVIKMSFFRKPITNKKPQRTVTLLQVYQAIRGHYYKDVISQLRALTDKEVQRRFKGKNLDYITPSGVFTYDDDKSLVSHSGILCMDLDDLEDLEALKQQLIDDSKFITLLLFRSPCGLGLKWFIEIDLSVYDHKTWFSGVRNYLMATYSLTDKQVDKSCSNLSRACFMSYDPDAYINEELLEHHKI